MNSNPHVLINMTEWRKVHLAELSVSVVAMAVLQSVLKLNQLGLSKKPRNVVLHISRDLYEN